MMRVCELAQHLGRTEEQMLNDLDAIGVTAKDGQTIVSQSVVERLTKRGQTGASHHENYVEILATLARSCHGSPLRSAYHEDNVEALAATAGEWTILKGPDGGHDAVILRYSAEESQQILTRLTTSELAQGSVPHAGNLSATIVDHLAKAAPFVAAGMQVGQVFKVVGTPALVEGLANGSMALMSTAGGSLGTVVSSSTGQIAGQLRFGRRARAKNSQTETDAREGWTCSGNVLRVRGTGASHARYAIVDRRHESGLSNCGGSNLLRARTSTGRR
jgi:hypothetical protein